MNEGMNGVRCGAYACKLAIAIPIRIQNQNQNRNRYPILIPIGHDPSQVRLRAMLTTYCSNNNDKRETCSTVSDPVLTVKNNTNVCMFVV